jgi:hypothetical protein
MTTMTTTTRISDPQDLDDPAAQAKVETYADWPMAKRIKVWLGSRLLYLVVRALLASYRYEIVGLDNRRAAEKLSASGSFCLAVWHEHLLATTLAHAWQPFAPLASPSADGAVVTYVFRKLGLATIRGSSSRGGPQARQQLIEETRRGVFTALTVDGPRGPRRRVKGGAVDIARKTGVPVLPCIAAAARPWVLTKTWDQFKIPRPFSRIVLAYGPPIVVPPETEGLAFGEFKNKVKDAIDAAESAALAAVARGS